MEKDTKVSIIVAIYKSEKFLKKLLDSIRGQTYENLEIILVDDGSPDNSGKICDQYCKLDDRFFVIHKKNGGACDARNKGIEAASGEFVTIIDGDDWLEPDYIEYLLRIAKDNNCEMSMTDMIFTTRNREQIRNDYIKVLTPEIAAASIIYPRIPIGPWNKLYKLKLIKDNKIDFNVPWSGEGLYFSFMCAQHSNRVALGHKKIYNYRLNNTESGLTNYNVQMGINACYNIQTSIRNNNLSNSKIIDRAVQWHIWKNYNYLLFLIIATNTQRSEYKIEYKNCLKNIRRGMPKVLLQSDLTVKEKLHILIQGIFPISVCKNRIKKEKKALMNDKMD